MVQIKYILPVVYLLLFMQCTKPAEPSNDAELRNDLEALKNQVTAFQEKHEENDDYVELGQFRNVETRLSLAENRLCKALAFPVQYFECFKQEIDAKGGEAMELRTSFAECRAALLQATQSSNGANSVPGVIHTPNRTTPTTFDSSTGPASNK